MKIKPILFKVIQQKRNVFKFQDKNVQLKRKKLKNILLKLSVKKSVEKYVVKLDVN